MSHSHHAIARACGTAYLLGRAALPGVSVPVPRSAEGKILFASSVGMAYNQGPFFDM